MAGTVVDPRRRGSSVGLTAARRHLRSLRLDTLASRRMRRREITIPSSHWMSEAGAGASSRSASPSLIASSSSWLGSLNVE
jgi:hypothetical protein